MRNESIQTTKTINDALLSAIRKADSILLISHVSPDGDTIGSALGLKLALEKLGKEITVACADNAPGILSFLKGWDQVIGPKACAGKSFDLAMAVDVSDEKRLGLMEEAFLQAGDTCQIDHHKTNPAFARVNVIDPEASATGLLVYDVMNALEIPMDKDIAMCLYTAISTDTGNFSFDNTTSQAFYVMSQLMAHDLPINKLNRILFRQKNKPQMLLMARALDSFTFYGDEQIVGMMLSAEDFAKCEALPEHAEAIVNYGIDTVGVKMAFLCRETDAGDIKFSLRALPPWDVAKIAAKFQGGGHNLAAGCTMPGPLLKASQTMVIAMEEALKDVNK